MLCTFYFLDVMLKKVKFASVYITDIRHTQLNLNYKMVNSEVF